MTFDAAPSSAFMGPPANNRHPTVNENAKNNLVMTRIDRPLFFSKTPSVECNIDPRQTESRRAAMNDCSWPILLQKSDLKWC
jgi:hypothetical protein